MASSKATLYYTPTSCGAASFIAAHVGKVDIQTEEVHLPTHTILSSGADFYTVNPKGNVPTLVLSGGQLMNEGAAILQYIADLAPGSGLAPANGTVERYLLQNSLNYISTEIQANGFVPLFGAQAPEHRLVSQEKLYKKFDYIVENMLDGGKKKFLSGSNFTIADSYLYIALAWAIHYRELAGIDLAKNAALEAYYNGIKALPEVQAAHAKMAEISAAIKK